MKKSTLFKGKAVACLVLMWLLLAQSCKKELLQPNSGDLQNGLTIVEAKQYFDANLKQLAKSKKLMDKGSGVQTTKMVTLDDVRNNKQPIWEKAHQMMISNGISVKIPIDFNQALAVVGAKKDVLPMSSLNYLLMYRDSLQQIHAEWVFLQPDSLWLYGSRDTYHGEVYVSDWNGKPIKKLSFPPHISANKSSKASSGSREKLMSVAEEPILTPNGNISICIRYKTGVCTCTSGPCDWMTCNTCGVTSCGKNLTVWIIDDKFPDGPDKPPTQGSGGESPLPGTGIGSGGAPNPNNYVPSNCNPDPNYVDPHIVNADGSMSIPACSDIPIPQCGNCPTSGPTQLTTLTKTEFLTLALALQPFETHLRNFVDNPANEFVVENMVSYLDNNGGNTQENISLLRWALGYLMENPDDVHSFIENNFGADDFISDNDYNSTNLTFDINNNGSPSFVSDNIEYFGFHNQIEPDYPQSHPVSQVIENYNPWIYWAFAGANNTSIKHFHRTAKGLAAKDGYSKAIGAIGEGLFVKRLTSVPVFPPARVIIGKYVGKTHIDVYLYRILPSLGNVGFEIAINYTTIDGTPSVNKISHPKGFTFAGQTTTAVAYEVKTYNADKNTEQSLFKAFNEGVNQVRHRANLPGIGAAILVFDDRAWKKLINSSYRAQVIATMNEITAVTNTDGEQIIYLRIEQGLTRDAQKVYFDLKNRIKDL